MKTKRNYNPIKEIENFTKYIQNNMPNINITLDDNKMKFSNTNSKYERKMTFTPSYKGYVMNCLNSYTYKEAKKLISEIYYPKR